MANNYAGIPDPMRLAREQATSNRVNTRTPTGSGTWTPGKNGGPATYTTSLNPTLTTANNQLDRTFRNAATDSRGVLGSPTLDFNKLNPMPVNPGQTGQDAIMSRLGPQIQRERDALHTQLVNWGLQPGTEAYDQALARQGETENDLLTRAALTGIDLDFQGRNQGLKEQQAAIETPLSVLQQLGGRGEAPYSPGQGVTGSQADLLSAWTAMNNQNNYQQNAGRQNTMDWLNLGVNAVKAAPDVYDWLSKLDWP